MTKSEEILDKHCNGLGMLLTTKEASAILSAMKEISKSAFDAGEEFGYEKINSAYNQSQPSPAYTKETWIEKNFPNQ